MEKILFLILIINSYPLYGWYDYYYQYSDFEWMDDRNLIVKRHEISVGEGSITSDIISINVDSKWISSLTPEIDGYCINEMEKIIYTYTHHEILLFDFSDDQEKPVMSTIFNLHSGGKRNKIINIKWVSGSVLMIYTFDNIEYGKIIYDYSKREIQKTVKLPQIPQIAYNYEWYRPSEDYWNFDTKDYIFYQVSVNSLLENALNNHSRLSGSGYPVLITINSDDNYVVLAGPFIDYDNALFNREKLDKDGWKGSLYRKKELYNIEGTDFWFNGSNIWIRESNGLNPLFIGGIWIEPVTIMGTKLIFLRSGSLWSYDFENEVLRRLSINGLDFQKDDFSETYIKFLCNTEKDEIHFDLYKNGENTYWSISSETSQLTEVIIPIDNIKDEYSINSMDNIMVNSNIDLRALMGIFSIEIFKNNKKLIIEFYPQSGGWSNSIFLIENSKKIHLFKYN